MRSPGYARMPWVCGEAYVALPSFFSGNLGPRCRCPGIVVQRCALPCTAHGPVCFAVASSFPKWRRRRAGATGCGSTVEFGPFQYRLQLDVSCDDPERPPLRAIPSLSTCRFLPPISINPYMNHRSGRRPFLLAVACAARRLTLFVSLRHATSIAQVIIMRVSAIAVFATLSSLAVAQDILGSLPKCGVSRTLPFGSVHCSQGDSKIVSAIISKVASSSITNAFAATKISLLSCPAVCPRIATVVTRPVSKPWHKHPLCTRTVVLTITSAIITLASGLCKAYGVDVPTQASCAASASSTAASTASSNSSGSSGSPSSASSHGGSSITSAPGTASTSASQSAAAQSSTRSPGAAVPVATAGAGLGLAVGMAGLLAAL